MTYAEYVLDIFIHSHSLSEAGLMITYSLHGRLKHLIAEPERAANLLAQVGYIDKYEMGATGATGEALPLIYLEGLSSPVRWENFAQAAKFSQYWAIQTAIKHESNLADSLTLNLFN